MGRGGRREEGEGRKEGRREEDKLREEGSIIATNTSCIHTCDLTVNIIT